MRFLRYLLVVVPVVLGCGDHDAGATIFDNPIPPDTADDPPDDPLDDDPPDPPVGSPAELPREYVDTTYDPPTGGTTHVVSAGGDIQAAIDAAAPGDIIEIEAGATWVVTTPYVLPDKGPSTDWIYIRSSAHASLPSPGTRIALADTTNMPTIRTNTYNTRLFVSDFGAHHYRIIGIRAQTTDNSYALMTFGYQYPAETAATSVSDLPTDIIIDRCVLDGGPADKWCVVGTNFQVVRGAVVDSYIYGCKAGQDAQAILVWNTPGPLKIVNNYLSGTGENFMSGGTNPRIPDLVPADVEFRGNYCFKPLNWKADDPSYDGYNWGVKNLFELKNAERFYVQGNVFENCWADAQVGCAILFTPRNDGGTAAWSRVRDITFIDNVVIDGRQFLNASAADDLYSSDNSERIFVSNNLARGGPAGDATNPFNVSFTFGAPGGGQTLNGLIVTNNTVIHGDWETSNKTMFLSNAGEVVAQTGVVVMDNIFTHGTYGVFGNAVGTGSVAMDTYWETGYDFSGNVLIGSSAANRESLYPVGNFHPQSIDDVEFVDEANGDYRLAGTSPYIGKGADIEMLESTEAAVVAGVAR